MLYSRRNINVMDNHQWENCSCSCGSHAVVVCMPLRNKVQHFNHDISFELTKRKYMWYIFKDF